MLVLGGTYREQVANPSVDTTAGSGLRAAAALTVLDPDVSLLSAVHDSDNPGLSDRDVAAMVADALGVSPIWKRRSKPVGWSYFTPLSAPSLNGSGARLLEPLLADADAVLAFGMAEVPDNPKDRTTIRARRVALDPQKPRDLVLSDLPVIVADEVLLILNERETLSLGRGSSLRESARSLLTLFDGWNVAAVVTKRGPRGALVTLPDGDPVTIYPHWTSRVYPIGSGDVFAAVTAWAWADQRHDPVTAASMGSAAAAGWCETGRYQVDPADLGGTTRDKVPVGDGLVYLAGPFFNLSERWLIDLVRQTLLPDVFSPLHDVGIGDLEVARKDLEGLHDCRSVLALLDGCDAGTLFECGYATNLHLPIVGFAERVDSEAYKMLAGTGATVTGDISTAVYQSIWAAMDPDGWWSRRSAQ